MKCPNCGSEMAKGEATLDKTLSNFLFCGFGSTNLFFREDEKPKVEIMTNYDRLRAYRCGNCGATTLAPRE